MCFNYDAWPSQKQVPKCIGHYDLKKNPIHYIGMSHIHNKEVRFEVSTNIIPIDTTSFIFSTSFLQRIRFNKEFDLDEESLENLRHVVQKAKDNRLVGIIPQRDKDGKKQWKLKFESGRNPKFKDEKFIERNFKSRFMHVF